MSAKVSSATAEAFLPGQLAHKCRDRWRPHVDIFTPGAGADH